MRQVKDKQIKTFFHVLKTTSCFAMFFGILFLSAQEAAANVAPVAVVDSYSFSEDKRLDVGADVGILSNDSDVDEGSILIASLIGDVSHGVLTLNADGSFSYIPNENFNGEDSFTYVANDGEYGSSEAMVTIVVKATNDSPTGADKTITVSENGVYVFSPDDFGFEDVDGDTMLGMQIGSSVNAGSLTIDGTYGLGYGVFIATQTIADGHLMYQPGNDESGDGYASFTFYIVDSSGDEASSISLLPNTIAINVAPADKTPIASDDESDAYATPLNTGLTIDSDEGVLANDTDADNDSLTAVIVSDPSHGTVILNDDGSFSYMPETDYIGSDSFIYEAFDGVSYSNSATVYLNVIDAPMQVIKADAVSLIEIRLTFNKVLENNDLVFPRTEDFKIYRNTGDGAEEIPLVGVSCWDRVVYVHLNEPINENDTPVYYAYPDTGDLGISETQSGDVNDAIAPTAVLTADLSTAAVGTNIVFSASGSNDVWSGIKQYVWSFGDGTVYTTAQASMSHPYSDAGTYNAVVTVYDNQNNSSFDQLNVTITDDTSSVGTASGGGGGGSSGGSSSVSSGVNSSTTIAIGGDIISSTTPAGVVTTTPSINGQVLGEKISRIDELIKITKYGERSENVRELQLELKNAGFFPKYQIATGYFGPITLNSVKKYLASQNRLAELRNTKIDELIALTKYGERSDNVKSLQTELKNAGFFPKWQIATGYFGPITLASVKRYQAYIML